MNDPDTNAIRTHSHGPKPPGGNMFAELCTSCSHYWAHNSGVRDRFAAITRICPTCISKRLPVLDGVELRDKPAVVCA